MKDYKTIWKQLAKDKKLTSRHFIQRAILIAMNSKSNMPKEDLVHILLYKYFSPVTNKIKMKNGYEEYDVIKLSTHQGYSCIGATKFLNDWRIWFLPRAKILDVSYRDFFDTEEEMELFINLHNSINENKIDRSYVYYFTVQDISPEQQAVQAAHVMYKLGSILGKYANPDKTYFQWIGVPNVNALHKIYNDNGGDVVAFYEPDMGMKMTSLALFPRLWFQRGGLVNYPLLKFNNEIDELITVKA